MSFSRKRGDTYSKRGFLDSVNAALEGVVHTLLTERNMRVHFIAGFFVLIAGVYFNLERIEFMLLCFAVSFVLVAEMFNTAVEHAVDLVSKESHPVAKIIKDISAGAVFVSAINAAITGYLITLNRINISIGGSLYRIKQSPWHITLIVLLVVVGLVLFIKVLRGERNLLRGGMPSGHAAVAFALWVVVSFASGDMFISILVLFLALLIARSRVAEGVHRLVEVIMGAVLGSLGALLIVQLLS